MAEPLASEKKKPTSDNKERKQPQGKFVKPERYKIDTKNAVIILGIDRFNYEQLKIISKNAKERILRLKDFVFETEFEPENARKIIDSAMLRVMTKDDKHYILSGRNKVRAAFAENETKIKAHVIEQSVVYRTLVPAKKLTQEELSRRIKPGVLLGAVHRPKEG